MAADDCLELAEFVEPAAIRYIRCALARSFVFGGYYGFYTIVIIALGLSGVLLLGDVEPDLVLTSIVRDVLPIGLRGAVFAALLAAVMSTGDSILNNASVIFTRDLYQKFFRPSASDQSMLRWSKATTMLIGAGGVVAAMSVPDVFELLVYTYTLWAPSIIPPLVVALVWGGPKDRRVSPWAAAPAIVAGISTTFLGVRVSLVSRSGFLPSSRASPRICSSSSSCTEPRPGARHEGRSFPRRSTKNDVESSRLLLRRRRLPCRGCDPMGVDPSHSVERLTELPHC